MLLRALMTSFAAPVWLTICSGALSESKPQYPHGVFQSFPSMLARSIDDASVAVFFTFSRCELKSSLPD
eukprot:8748912-Pyramimonas_sp.AAC.1